MRTLVIINDPPYGTERAYNALRLGMTLQQRPGEEARIFLMGDAALCAKCGQQLPNGYYSIERMLMAIGSRGGDIAVCGSCMDARGVTEQELVGASHRSTMEELADWTLWADRVLVF